MKKRIAVILLLICLPLALFAGGQQEQSGSAEETTEKVLQVGMVSAPMTFNVTATTGTYSTMPMDFVLGTLVSIDGDQEFQPWAASSWEVSEDGRTYTFNLNPDLNWHDGNPVVAEDVKMSLELLTHPDNNALLYGRLNGIEGVDEFYEKKADSISGVKVVDEKTVQITTKVPTATLLNNLMYYILPSHILGDVAPADIADHSYWQKPVGFGPFKFVEYKTDQYILMEKNEDCAIGVPKIDKLIFRIGDTNTLTALAERGEVDIFEISPDEAERLETSDLLNVVTVPYGSVTQMMHVNLNRPYLDDPKVRQGLAHAINREGMARSLYNGHARPVPTHPLPAWVSEEGFPTYEFNPEKGKKLLQEAGFPFDQKLVLRVPSGNKPREKMAPIIKQGLQDIGVEVDIVVSDFTTCTALIREGDYDLGLQGWWGMMMDPDDLSIVHHSKNIPKAGYNLSFYDNPRVDELLQEGREKITFEDRAPVYHELGKLLAEELPLIPMASVDAVYAANKRVKNFKPTNFRTWGHYDQLWNILELDVE